jgi:hypothetical protein
LASERLYERAEVNQYIAGRCEDGIKVANIEELHELIELLSDSENEKRMEKAMMI